jgi:hypothetical protein
MIVVPFATINEQSGIFVPSCPALSQGPGRKGFFAAAFPRSMGLLQARPMSARIIIVIPITGPASA